MIENLSSIEVALVKSSLLTKTDEELAEVLELPVEQVTELISAMMGEDLKIRISTLARNKQESEMKNAANIKRQARKEYVKTQKLSDDTRVKRSRRDASVRQAQEDLRKKQVAKREAKRAFKTRTIDYSKMKTVKVDRNTYVWVDKSVSNQAAIDLYQLNKSLKDRAHLPTNNTKYATQSI